ncbi:Trk potassium uptake system protein TrkH [hydrothermal vent metagenome]|uniref:Trk potassium uptake system protein TrkH n=1 Tax=hydrothermal vent metagenome TaxID=652676 RepID=A0A3B0RGD9_9ZZZZ
MTRIIQNAPLILILMGIAALAMFVPMVHALANQQFLVARAFGYAAILGLALVFAIGLAMSGRARHDYSDLDNLVSLLLAFTVLPLFLAVPFHAGVQTTSFLNAYFEMVSSLTTTGATLFDTPGRLVDSLHLWRGLVGWMGGLLIWVAAAAVLAPLNLGGFEVTASAEPGQGDTMMARFERANSSKRLLKVSGQLIPLYAGLTAGLWLLLVISGDRPVVAMMHAMATLATSGISPVGGMQGASSGFGGEAVIFLFLLFALSRLTFSSDTMTTARPGLNNDPEFRLGMLLVLGVPMLLVLRHFIAALEIDEVTNISLALKAFWGGMFTVLSFLSTTGFESADWSMARDWSGLSTPGMILLGLAVMGGGVATTAGGVKLLRVYVLYLNSRRELEHLVHPSSVGRTTVRSRRIRRKGAVIAWIFFMLFAMSLALITVVLASLGLNFEQSIVLAISALSTTGPLTQVALETPIDLQNMGDAAKLVMATAMVLGRLEILAIIALINPALWRET